VTIKRATASDHGTNAGWDNSFDRQVVLNGTSINMYGLSMLDGIDHVVIDGAVESGIKIKVNMGYGIAITPGNDYPHHDVTIRYVEIQGPGTNLGTSYANTQAIHGGSVISDHITVDHCRLYNFSGALIRLDADYITLSNSELFLSDDQVNHENAIISYHSSHGVLKNNTIHDIGGVAVALANVTTPCQNWSIYNNILYQSGVFLGNGTGIAAERPSLDIRIYHNTVVGFNHPIDMSKPWTTGEAYNNIFYGGVNGGALYAPGFLHDYNWHLSGAPGIPANEGSHSVESAEDPFINKALFDFHLRSLAQTPVDSGVALGQTYASDRDGTGRPQGSGWDMGTFEYVPPVCEPNTYYIDFNNGDDNNDGKCTNSAWKHTPGDDNAAGNADATALVPGDVVKFKGGVDYLGRIDLDWSGNSGGYITFDGNSENNWESGNAIINGQNIDSDSRRYAFYGTAARSYLIIRNFNITRMGGHSSYSDWLCSSPGVAGSGIYLVTSSNIKIQNNIFSELGDWGNRAGMSINQMDGKSIVLYGSASDVLIEENEFTRVTVGVSVDARNGGVMRNITISGSDIHHDIRWGIAVVANAAGTTLQDIDIHDNKIRDVWQYAPSTWMGCSGLYPHFDGIIMYIGNNPPYPNQILGNSTNPIRIYNNLFYNDNATASDAGTAMIFLTGFGGRVLIYNNVFINTLSPFGGIYAQDGTSELQNNPFPDYHIYQNTFFDKVPGISLRTLDSAYAINKGNVSIKNNVFYYPSGFPIQFWWNEYSNPTTLDYNSYYTMRSDKLIVQLYNASEGGRVYYDFTKLQNVGYELHGIYGNPLFFDISYGIGALSSSNNLHLQPASPAINKGTPLSAFLAADMEGNPRPQGPAWDMGAYEFTGTTYHPSDTDQDSCVETDEMVAFIDRWKISSSDVRMPELMESIGLWKTGVGC
jgi:hypothetical protein